MGEAAREPEAERTTVRENRKRSANEAHGLRRKRLRYYWITGVEQSCTIIGLNAIVQS